MKTTIYTFLCLLIHLIFINCSHNDIELKDNSYIHESDKFNITAFIESSGGVISKNNTTEDVLIHSVLATSFEIPNQLTDAQIEAFITENTTSINGELNYYMNDEVFLSYEIVNGEFQQQTVEKNRAEPGDYPCSYDGIQDCTQAAVDDWSTTTALICAFTGGLSCIAQEAAVCVTENCILN
jgi:hypothetical protein